MAVVAWGIRLVLIGVILFWVGMIGAFGIAFADLPPVLFLVSGLVILGGAACGFVGPFLCLAAPADTGAKPFLVVSIVCQLVNMTINILPNTPVDIPGWLPFVGVFAWFVGLIFFVLFLKALAGSLGRSDLDGEADAVISAAVFTAAAYAAMLIPLLGCIAFFFLIGMAIYFLYKYVALLSQMAAATAAAR